MKRWMSALALIVALAVCASGCATIPRSGPVREGQTVAHEDDQLGPVDYLPSGPARGATPAQILRGFIDAAVSPQDSYAIAREFLAPDFQSVWNPDASVTIDSGTHRTLGKLHQDHIELSVTPLAIVDADGNYRPTDSSVPVAQSFAFEKVRGQWRIAKAPDGIVIDQQRFTDVFSAHTLYFFSPDYRYLVPDQRWFAARPNIQTRIVKAIVSGGPSRWLAGAVANAFPQGTKLTVDSAPISYGRVEVDLNSAASNVSQLTLQRMKLQLIRSLVGVAAITQVKITINGVERTTVDLGANAPQQDPAVDANPLVMKAGRFGFLTGSSVTEVPDLSKQMESLAPEAATVSADRRVASVLTSDGVYALRAGHSPLRVDSRPGVIAPSLDNSGYVWSVPAKQPNAIRVSGPNGASSTVKVAWPDAASIRSLAVSRDGTRVVALIDTGHSEHVMGAGIIRTADNLPDRLTEPVDFGAVSGSNARSLTWMDELDVGLLMTDATGDPMMETQQLGGLTTQLSAPPDGIALAGGTGSPAYWVLTSAHSLQGPRGTNWQERSGDVTLLATQLGRPSS